MGFLVAVLLGFAAAGGLVQLGLAQVDRGFVAGLVENRAQAAVADGGEEEPRLLNVLVVGNDSREGLSGSQQRELLTGKADGNRTDTVMLLQLELHGAGRGAVLSFPRDLLVTRCDGTRGRINAAYGVGVERDGDGPSCVVETVTDMTGIDIHHYVEVSFKGFLDVVDALGGVGLYLDEPVVDEKTQLDLPAGCVRLQGRDALSFVRARELDNDFGRIARQQRFIKEAVREATAQNLLTDPARLVRVLDAAAAAVRTDDRLGIAEMREIATGLRRITAQGLEVYTVPSEARLSGGTWYVEEHPLEAAKLYEAFRSGRIVRDGPPPSEQATETAKPPVTVLNATDHAGLAAAAASFLERKGYPVSDVDDAQTGARDVTRILHPPALAREADALADLFPEADVVEGVDTLPLTLKLGSDAEPERFAEGEDAHDAVTEGTEPGGQSTEAPDPAQTYRGALMTDVDC